MLTKIFNALSEKKEEKKIFSSILVSSIRITKTKQKPQNQAKPNKNPSPTWPKLWEIQFVIFRLSKNCVPSSSKAQGEQ